MTIVIEGEDDVLRFENYLKNPQCTKRGTTLILVSDERVGKLRTAAKEEK